MHRPRRAQRRVLPLWLWPTLTGVLAAVLGEVATRLQLGGRWAQVAWPGSSDSATTLVQTVASTVVTVTTLTFTLTVVALQLASQQFSPRLLREFTRDPVVKQVLSILVGTFVGALTVLRTIDSSSAVPAVAALLVLAAGLASLVAVLAFITHLVRILRIDTMMLAVHDETSNAIDTFYPPHGDRESEAPTDDTFPPGRGRVVEAPRSGFLRTIGVARLVAGAQEHDLMVNVLVRPGDHVVTGTPVAEVWQRTGQAPHSAVAEAVNATLGIGYERTLEQDAAFGFRMLEDIAVKALSPGINDPVTAVHAIGHMSDLLVRLTGCRLGSTVHHDSAGVPRAVVPDRDLAYYLELACGQTRRYGKREPTVLAGLLRMLRDVATSARDDEQRRAIADAAALVARAADPVLLPEERRGVADLNRRVGLALEGDLVAAYADRAGETRSL